MVFIFNSFVVKIPLLESWKSFLNGLLANLQERAFTATNWRELCPVVASCPLGFWLIMPFVRPLTNDEWEGFDYFEFAFKDGYVIPVENKRNSFGVYKGEVVAIDYGT